MEIEITKRTKTKDILPFITTINFKELLNQVEVVPLETALTDMTIAEFNDIISEPDVYVTKLAKENKKALVFLGRCKDLYNSIEGFNRFIKRYEVKQSPEEMQAAVNVPFPNFGNSMLVTLIKNYNLKSVEEASNMKLKEYMLFFEYEASNAIYSRRYSDIIRKKTKK